MVTDTGGRQPNVSRKTVRGYYGVVPSCASAGMTAEAIGSAFYNEFQPITANRNPLAEVPGRSAHAHVSW